MPHNQSWLLASIALALVLVACSSADATGATSGASTIDKGACTLQSIGLTFTRPECTECMQSNCCSATIACFSPGSSGCNDVFTCVNACPSHGAPLAQTSDAGHPEGVWTGTVDDSDAGAEDHGDAGPVTDPCVDACNAQDPSAAAVDTDYLACYRGRCLDVCSH